MIHWVRQYRLVAWHRPRTPWRFDRASVIEDGVDLGMIHRYPRAKGGDAIYFDIMVEIAERRVAADAVLVRLGERAA